MKLQLILLFMCIPVLAYSQKTGRTALIKIVNFHDTSANSRTSDIKALLINTSDTTIVVCEHASIDAYMTGIYEKDGKTRQLTPGPISLMKYDGMPVQYDPIMLKPGESKEFSVSWILWGYSGRGKVKTKVLFELTRLNPGFKNAESNWFYQYLP